MLQKLHQRITIWIKVLQKFADRIWYAPLIGLLAALDNLIVVIPNDGILISSSMLIPKRWFIFALSVTIGSLLGALFLAALVNMHGLPMILDYYPGAQETKAWAWTQSFFDRYGLMVVFFVAITPLAQQPAIILASLAGTPLSQLAAIIFCGRLIKFLIMAYIGSHAPKLLSRMWGVREELEEAGIQLEKIS